MQWVAAVAGPGLGTRNVLLSESRLVASTPLLPRYRYEQFGSVVRYGAAFVDPVRKIMGVSRTVLGFEY